jgi:uncharacterized membrane protein (Fun14 family)
LILNSVARKVGATSGSPPFRQPFPDAGRSGSDHATEVGAAALLRHRKGQSQGDVGMRTLLALIGIIALVVVALMYFGLINIDQTRSAVVQAPQFKADVARVSVGTENKTVAVPTVNVEKPGNAQ